ncbi:MAG: ATP-binding cassette domain-containing protein [Pirellulaceae bacterium]
MTNISKRFPGVRALDDVQLMVRNGEVHAVVGENGAGKSTLMHILAGVHQPDTGRIDVSGKQGVRIQGERMAQHLGIAIVYQERSLFESLSLAENIFAGRQPVWGGVWIARHRMISESRKLLAEVNLALDPATLLGALSPAEQQLVEIAKALSLNARLIILDEPTAALPNSKPKRLRRYPQAKKRGKGSDLHLASLE